MIQNSSHTLAFFCFQQTLKINRRFQIAEQFNPVRNRVQIMVNKAAIRLSSIQWPWLARIVCAVTSHEYPLYNNNCSFCIKSIKII